MNDLEKIGEGLRCCAQYGLCLECPYNTDPRSDDYSGCFQMHKEAAELFERFQTICDDSGLTPDGVAFALGQYQRVISEITGGLLSKLTYKADYILDTFRERWCEDCDLKEEQGPRVLALDEILEGAGGGWAEDWWEASEEDGTPEERVLRQVAWCRGCVIDGTCSSLGAERLREIYQKKYGTRIWTGLPTDEQRTAEPWEEARPMSEAKEAGR